ncbi:phospholipase D family protein [bacterium]|nr:phospholipase D family protein [bacterium]
MKTRPTTLLLLSLITILLLISSCATLPEYVPQTPTWAWQAPEQTTAGRIFADDIAAHPGKSGAILLPGGREALLTRNAMAGIAERTLDVQYYIWKGDTVGLLLLQRLVEAADRGVRVRVLLDDQTVKAKDLSLASFSGHPNMEIRLFNPLAGRGKGAITFLADFSRVNHRMHNKLFVMDNTVAVIGGRNIADRYFGVSSKANTRDLDVAVVGPVVQELSGTFDLFWNSQWAYPVETLAKKTPGPEERKELRKRLSEEVSAGVDTLPWSVDIDTPAMYSRLEELRPEFTWAPMEVLYDTPDKVQTSEARIVDASHKMFDGMNEEFLMEVAYFIPGKEGVARVKVLTERGIKVKVLTNSLASNNVLAAHAGYAKYRVRMLEAGAEMYEYRPTAAERKDWSPAAADAPTQMHTKTYVIDRKMVFIGTFNLDPRSKVLNTEIGVLIHHPGFAQQAAAFIDRGMEPGNAYRVVLDEESGEAKWIRKDGEKTRTYSYDPQSSFWKSLGVVFIQLFPIEGQL